MNLGEYAEIVVDFGGRVEDLVLKSQSQGKLRSVLLTHNGNATAIKENAWWKGMLLVPWANRIAYVSNFVVCSPPSAKNGRSGGNLLPRFVLLQKFVVRSDCSEKPHPLTL